MRNSHKPERGSPLTQYELAPGIAVIPPATESLMNAPGEGLLWPQEVRNNPELRTQAEMRRALSAQVDSLFKKMPQATTEVADAVDSKLVDSDMAAATYESLTNFLEADDRNKRILLYLPFELLPPRGWRPPSEGLAKAAGRFTTTYMKEWNELLAEEELRANFVDGDIPEPELGVGAPERVRKAAHLIPKLAHKGLVSPSEVVALAENATNDVLRRSIIDTLPVLVDMHLLPEAEWKRMEHSFGAPPERTVLTRESPPALPKTDYPAGSREWLRILADGATHERETAQRRYASRSPENIPQARLEWEGEELKRRIVEAYSAALSDALVKNSLSPENLQQFVSSADATHALIAIRAVGRAVETLARNDPKSAASMSTAHEPLLRGLWEKDAPEARDALMSAWSRWASVGVIDRSYVEKFDAEMPRLDSLLSADNKLIIGKETQELLPALQRIESDAELSQFLYPVFIAFGSRLKGYATNRADLDVATFVKPGIPIEERPALQRLIAETFSHEKVGGKVVEFWLEKHADGLAVRDFPNPDNALADSTWVHILFGGIWCGKEASMKELYEKLLPGYLFSKDKKIGKYDARRLWLGEMEREVLQYRLMHNGYARYHAEQGGIDTPHSGAIDSKSTFWDSGYRRLATRLFIQRVFLPQLERPHA